MRSDQTITKLFALAMLSLLISASSVNAGDWANWRGPNYDGISTESGWSYDWPESGPKQLWTASVGKGFGSITVGGGQAYTMGNKDEKDTVYCFDAESGKPIWSHTYEEPLSPKLYEGGPNASVTIDSGKVYTLSKSGKVHCLDSKTGNVIWQNDLKESYGLEVPKWGHSSSPFLWNEKLIVNAGTWGLALNKTDGSLLWKTGKDIAAYATAVPFAIDGKTGVAIFGTAGVAGIDVESGKVLWMQPWETNYKCNVADPIIDGNKVFISSGYNRGCSLLEVSGGKVTQLWEHKDLRNHINSSVLFKGNLYGFDGQTGGKGELKCVDFESGTVKWAQKGFGTGSLLIADGKLIILGEKGKLTIAEVSPAGYKELASAQILEGKCWTVPTLANGRIYARNAVGDVVCLDVK